MDVAHGGQGLKEGGAEQAFEALREEVVSLRRLIEMLYRQVQHAGRQPAAASGPDYSLMLGKIEKALQAIAGRLEVVERQPALQLTPASFKDELDLVTESASVALSKSFLLGVKDVRAAADTLETLIGRVCEQRQQRRQLWIAGGGGVVGGVLLCLMLAAFLPGGAGKWLAAVPLGGDWRDGKALLYEADPAMWDRMARLNNACPTDSTIDLCEAAMTIGTMPPLPPPQEER